MKEMRAKEQSYLPYPAQKLRTRGEAIKELLRPFGRFRSPLSFAERARLSVIRRLQNIDILEDASSVVGPGMPLSAHLILRYMHQRGIIKSPKLHFQPVRHDVPKLYLPGLEAVRDDERTDGERIGVTSAGHAPDAELAISQAVGEILERHFLTVYKRDALVRATPDELRAKRKRALDLDQYAAFEPWQYEVNRRFERSGSSLFYWAHGETLDGKRILIPAQLAYWNYQQGADRTEPVLGIPNTNGSAGHFTKQEAILSGLLESIERDGFLVYWLNSLTPKRIEVDSIDDDEVRELLASVRRHDLEIHFLDTTTDIRVPATICAIVDRRTDDPVVVVGGGIGFDVRSTILKSAYETLSILNWTLRQEPFAMDESKKQFTDRSIGHHERIRLWRGPKLLERFEFFIKGGTRSFEDFIKYAREYDTVEKRFAYVVAQLREKGPAYEPYIFEAHDPVLDTLGFHVVQTIVPALMPLYLREDSAPLKCARLREAPKKLGLAPAETLNPWPHPFP